MAGRNVVILENERMNKVLFRLLLILFLSIPGFSQASVTSSPDTLSFQLENKATGLLLRPLNASKKDGAQLVLYPQYDWRCLTWDAIPDSSGFFYFRNYFSNKSIRSVATQIEQQPLPLDSDNSMLWKMIEVEPGYYKIVSANDESLVLTAPENSSGNVYLAAWTGSASQYWKMLPKPGRFSG